MESRIIEIANFREPERAAFLVSLLEAEGIESYIRNEVSSSVMRGYVDIGARVEILDKDLPMALEIMRNAGYALPDDEPELEYEKGNTELARKIPFLRNLSFEKQLVIIIGLILGFVALLIYLQAYFSTENIH